MSVKVLKICHVSSFHGRVPPALAGSKAVELLMHRETVEALLLTVAVGGGSMWCVKYNCAHQPILAFSARVLYNTSFTIMYYPLHGTLNSRNLSRALYILKDSHNLLMYMLMTLDSIPRQA